MTTPISRRAVLRGIAIGATAPAWVRFADPAAAAAATNRAQRHLLVVFLRGGNDALGTVAPIGDPALDRLRPRMGLRAADALLMGNGYGVTRALPSFHRAWRDGHLAVVQQTGPTRPDFSHGSAAQKWESGHPDAGLATGWLGRYLDTTPASGPIRAVAFGDALPLTLAGRDSDAVSMRSLATFAMSDRKGRDVAARRAAMARMAQAQTGHGPLAAALLRGQRHMLDAAAPLSRLATESQEAKLSVAENAAQLFGSGLGTEIGFINLGGFDTHTDQRARHARAIGQLDAVVSKFLGAAEANGVAERSAVMVVSEFGRRVAENGSGGTDHGYGTSVFLLGRGVRGGMYGPAPDYADLPGGNLPVRVDIRRVYASVLAGWMRTNPAHVLGGEFATLPLFR